MWTLLPSRVRLKNKVKILDLTVCGGSTDFLGGVCRAPTLTVTRELYVVVS